MSRCQSKSCAYLRDFVSQPTPLPSPPLPQVQWVLGLCVVGPVFSSSLLIVRVPGSPCVVALCSRYVEIYLETVRDLLEPSSINLEVPAPASPLHLFVHAATCLTYWSLLVVTSTGQRGSL
jgi:hypothetical protein